MFTVHKTQAWVHEDTLMHYTGRKIKHCPKPVSHHLPP